MPDRNTYKLLRSGTVRSSYVRGTGRSSRYRQSGENLAPNIEAFGHRAFRQRELRALAKWLHSDGWPRGSLNIVGLEGLLTALLLFDTGLRPGSWLPLIWNESGWKLPTLLRDEAQFTEFTELVCGFRRKLDDQFKQLPPCFESVIEKNLPTSLQNGEPVTKAWATGFSRIINASQHINTPANPLVRRALYVIASLAQSSHAILPSSGRSLHGLTQAVVALIPEHMSRGRQ